MAYDTFLAHRVRQRLSTAFSVAEKKMMGGLVFMVNDNMCIGVDTDRKTGDNRLMVRVGNASYEKLLNNKGCREMDFTGNPMKGYLFIYPEGFENERDMDFWVGKALEFNKILLAGK